MNEYVDLLIKCSQNILNKNNKLNKSQLNKILLGYFKDDKKFLGWHMMYYLNYDANANRINKVDYDLDNYFENIYYQIQIDIIVPLMKNIVNLIKEKDPSQADLTRLLGFDIIENGRNQKDYIVKTLTDRLIEQKIIKQVDKKIGQSKKFFEVISENEYAFPEYLSLNEYGSKLSKLVKNVLKNYPQYIIKTEEKGKIINKRATRYDFVLYKKDKKYLVIEIDGLQHHQYVEYFHKNIKNFLNQVMIDKIKERYVKEEWQCHFMRIKNEDEIKSKLIKFLNNV